MIWGWSECKNVINNVWQDIFFFYKIALVSGAKKKEDFVLKTSPKNLLGLHQCTTRLWYVYENSFCSTDTNNNAINK